MIPSKMNTMNDQICNQFVFNMKYDFLNVAKLLILGVLIGENGL